MAYKCKDIRQCHMHDNNLKLNCLILNASLKHKPNLSNTEELSELVAKNLKKHNVTTEIIRLVDYNIEPGLTHRVSKKDQWPKIADKLIKADIVIFATPVWWGNISSMMQRIIERMDALDEDYSRAQENKLYNKPAGIIITGSEDGALHCIGQMMDVFQWLGFTFPPECAAYWVGEVGQPVKLDRKKRLKNKSTKVMASRLARNLAYYGQLLHNHPLKEK